MVSSEGVPRILGALLDTQRNPSTFFVDIEDHHLNLIADLHDLGRMDVAVGPVHFGHVHQPLDALFQFCKATIIGEVGDLRHGSGVLRISTCNFNPGILTQLFETQGDTIPFAVELQNLNINLITHCDDFTRMLDSLPRHVRNVQ